MVVIHSTAVPRWEHFEHRADMGIRGLGASPAEAFEQAASALTAVITDLSKVIPVEAVDISCDAPDLEYLLVDWLNSLIFEMSTRHLLFSRFSVEIQQGTLCGRAWGEPVDVPRHCPTVEVKGATYTALRVVQNDTGQWIAQAVVDV